MLTLAVDSLSLLSLADERSGLLPDRNASKIDHPPEESTKNQRVREHTW